MREDIRKGFPDGLKSMLGVENVLDAGPVDRTLLDLLRVRVSQSNRCAFCLDMYTSQLRRAGETEQRLNTLAAWRDTPLFTDEERAALALAEALTLLPGSQLPDTLVDEARRHFSPAEVAQLVWAIAAINAWNRVNVVTQPTIRVEALTA
jgi:AhpD family alkylhydroperoxidase